jgi:hypothetical protein
MKTENTAAQAAQTRNGGENAGMSGINENHNHRYFP